MAGLLDFLNSDDARLGLGLLAASGPQTDPSKTGFGYALQSAMADADARKKAALQTDYLKAQIGDTAAQAAIRQQQAALAARKQAIGEQVLRDSGFAIPGATTGAAIPGDSTSPMAPGGGGASGGGLLGATVPDGSAPMAQGAPAPMAAAPGPRAPAAASNAWGLNLDPKKLFALKAGDIGDFTDIYKTAQPNWVDVGGGNYVNTNDPQFHGGFQTRVTQGPNGVQQLQYVGPNGLPAVAPLAGTMGMLKQSSDITEGAKAGQDIVNVRDKNTGELVPVPRSALVAQYNNAAPPGSTASAPLGGTDAPPSSSPLGIRNNNPGNLRPPGQSSGFQQFDTPEQGIAALDSDLRAKGDPNRGINTLNKLFGGTPDGKFGGYAPAADKNDPSRYAATVAARLGISPDTPIDLRDPLQRHAISGQIALVENGSKNIFRSGGGTAAPTAAPQATPGGPTTATTAAPTGPRYIADFSPEQKATQEAQARAATSIAGEVGPTLKDAQTHAEGAVKQVQIAQRLQDTLDNTATLTGPGSTFKLKALQYASVLGTQGKDTQETLTQTRSAIRDLAKLTMQGRLQMSGQGAITERESNLAEKANSGSIDDMTGGELKELAAAAERAARWDYGVASKKFDSINTPAAQAGGLSIFKPVDIPPPYQPRTPAGTSAAPAAPGRAAFRWNPATGKLDKVQ